MTGDDLLKLYKRDRNAANAVVARLLGWEDVREVSCATARALVGHSPEDLASARAKDPEESIFNDSFVPDFLGGDWPEFGEMWEALETLLGGFSCRNCAPFTAPGGQHFAREYEFIDPEFREIATAPTRNLAVGAALAEAKHKETSHEQ